MLDESGTNELQIAVSAILCYDKENLGKGAETWNQRIHMSRRLI